MMNEEKVQIIKIDPRSKYAIVVLKPLQPYELELIKEKLSEWWKSDEPFLVVTSDIRIERLEQKEE